jgi:hypothetical protein
VKPPSTEAVSEKEHAPTGKYPTPVSQRIDEQREAADCVKKIKTTRHFIIVARN